MSLTLGIDTSSIDLGIGLYRDNIPLSSYSRYVRNSHAEHLTQAVKMIMESNSINPEEISHIAISCGPGSFTGLRIGIAFVKGFCTGMDIPVYPVSSLEVLAHAALRKEGRVLAAIDARNDHVFWGEFFFTDWKISRVSQDRVGSINEFCELIDENSIIVTDKMGYQKSTVFSSLNTSIPVEKCSLQRGLYCALLGSSQIDNKSVWLETTEILPNYLRESPVKQQVSKVSI
jgi:tRNA threonylcarbamoyladenosine biosynthesis protein TsaB